VASINITGRKFLSFDGNFTTGLGMLFQKVKPAQLPCQYFETIWKRLVTPNSEWACPAPLCRKPALTLYRTHTHDKLDAYYDHAEPCSNLNTEESQKYKIARGFITYLEITSKTAFLVLLTKLNISVRLCLSCMSVGPTLHTCNYFHFVILIFFNIMFFKMLEFLPLFKKHKVKIHLRE